MMTKEKPAPAEIDSRDTAAPSKPAGRLRKIYIGSAVIFIFFLAVVVYLLFLEGDRPVLPFVFTSNTSKNDDYSVSYEIGTHPETETNHSHISIFDTQNLSIRNSIDRTICVLERCPSPDIPENINISFQNATFRIYDVTNEEFYISDTYQDGEIRYGLSQNGQLTNEFASTAALEEHLQSFLAETTASPASLRLFTIESLNSPYYFNLYSNYMEFYQEDFSSNCKIFFDVSHRGTAAYFVAQSVMSVHESCPAGGPPDLQLHITFALGEPIVFETYNVAYDVQDSGVSRSSEGMKYIIVVDSAKETLLSAADKKIDFYTITYDQSLTSNVLLSLLSASITLDNLTGNLIYGKNEFLVPLYSTLQIRNISSLDSIINYAVYDPDNPQSSFTVQARGNSDDVAINNESLISDKNKELENFKSLAIPVLTAILSGVLSFVLGLFVGKQDDS
jgi:hypothetical protein